MAKWRNENGFTAGELLVAIAIIGLVLAAVLSIHQGALQAYLINSTSTETQQNARIALDRMAREIREAQAVTTAQASSITFTDQTGAAVTYTLNGSNLDRNGQTLVGGVAALTFVYRDVNDATGATAANTRRAEITIQTRTEDTVPAGSAFTTQITTSVRLRNAP